jgi:predicted O-methyltransferase YrrM
MIGPAASWFRCARDGDSVVVKPQQSLPRRCTIRPAALFQQDRGFPDVNTVMGRLVFANGATGEQRYTPFSRDPQRKLRELFLPVEVMPDDDWSTSATRWSNFQAIAKRLLAVADVPWAGLSSKEIDELVTYVEWAEPLEGCLLHALTQWTHARGQCVIEIGSYRGRSLSMLAIALRGVASESKLISIDPHTEQPHNHVHARLALAQLGEEGRLVQIRSDSDQAWRLLRPGVASLIYVDGDHSHRQVVADFENYRDLLATGGCIVFHDYGYGNHNGREEPHPGVRRAVDEQVFGSKQFRPLLLGHGAFAFVKTNG